jgi:hypothetical protein
MGEVFTVVASCGESKMPHHDVPQQGGRRPKAAAIMSTNNGEGFRLIA